MSTTYRASTQTWQDLQGAPARGFVMSGLHAMLREQVEAAERVLGLTIHDPTPARHQSTLASHNARCALGTIEAIVALGGADPRQGEPYLKRRADRAREVSDAYDSWVEDCRGMPR